MKKRTWIIIGGAIILIAIIFFATRGSGSKYQFVSVGRGTIAEEVSVTGNTTAVHNLSLSFESGGTVASVNKNTGDTVSPGDTLVRLDTRDLQAQLAQAQASVDAAQANLSKLQAGPTPQAVSISQAAVATAQQTLTNSYGSINDAITSAFAKANDAVRNQISAFFSSAETNSPQLTFSLSDAQLLNNVNFQRLQVSQELNAWQTELGVLSPTSPTSTLVTALTKGTAHLAVIGNFLTTVSTAVVNSVNIPATTLSTYKTAVANAVTEVNSASTGITTLVQAIASQNAAIAQAQANLNNTLAGVTANDIAAQKALVEQAQANEQSIQVRIAKASLTSPISGIVTVQNAKVGQIASPGQTITSLISNNNLEIDANVPETDIGKVAVGNPVKITFDAFSGESFSGKVFYIDPAETIVSGVVDYKIKVSLDKSDSRIKSGLTANLDIKTVTRDNTLILPQFAVIQNTSDTFVQVLENGNPKDVPVTLGVRDQQGNVEILSGISEGQQVINVGLKTQ